MPPIPIYSNSPINAAKADGVTPQTADKGQNGSSPPLPTTTTAAAAAQGGPPPAYPAAQPGASPAIPAPTGAPTLPQYQPAIQPTPTQPLAASQGPPPPQPGAVPLAPGTAASTGGGAAIGPPTKATTTATPSTTTAPPPYPAQMNIPPPMGTATGAIPQSVQRGTSTAATTTTFSGGFIPPGPSPLEHPPGYHQDVNADALNRYQRAAQDALEEEERRSRRTSSVSAGLAGLAGGDGEEGVWSGAKKMMAAAGEKLAAAEGEVWKRINKE